MADLQHAGSFLDRSHASSLPMQVLQHMSMPHLQSPCCWTTAMGLSLEDILPEREPLPVGLAGGGVLALAAGLV